MESVALDTNVFVRVVEGQRGWEKCAGILEDIEAGRMEGVVSTVVLAELSVGFHRRGRSKEKGEFFARLGGLSGYRVVPVTATIADRGGGLRAETGLPLPDALIAATALETGAGALLTDDREFKRLDGAIRVVSPRNFG